MKHFNRKKQFFGKIAAKILHILLWPWIYYRRSFPQKPHSILIFDFHLIGDIVLLTPLLLKLRQKNPHARIALVAGPWAKHILESHPHLFDEFYPVTAPWVIYDYRLSNLMALLKLLFKLRQKEWDWGIEIRGDLRQILLLFFTGVRRRVSYNFTGGAFLLTDVVGDNRSPKHLLDHNYQIFKNLYPEGENKDFMPQLWLTTEEQSEVNQSKQQSIVGFHPGASLPLRRLPYEKSLELLQSILKVPKVFLHIFQGPDEQQLIHEILSKMTDAQRDRIQLISVSLRKFIVELAKCDVFIGMDSGSAHLASALGVPVYVVFGPADPVFCQPVGKNVQIVMLPNQNVPCRPCDQKHCIHSQYQFCMKSLPLKNMGTRIQESLRIQ